jgi:AraC-like DNA-binding protein
VARKICVVTANLGGCPVIVAVISLLLCLPIILYFLILFHGLEKFMERDKQILPPEEILQWQSRVERIKNYVNENLSAKLDASSVASRMKLTSYTLQTIFKKCEGETFHKYVERVKMQKALELLAEGKWVKEIMAYTGYKHRATFDKAFKRRYKVPAAYFKK